MTEIFDEQESRIRTSKNICKRLKKLHTIPIGDVALRAVPELTNHPIDRSVTGCVLRRNKSKKIIRIKLKRKVQLAKSHYGSIGFAGGDTNLYAYVGGNPMSYNDPTGNCPWCIGAIVGGVAGGVSAYLAGGDSQAIGAAILIGTAAGAGSMGLSALTTSAAGTILGNGAIGLVGNVATQLSTGTSLRNINTTSVAIGTLGGAFGGWAGLAAGNKAFFSTPVIGNPVGNAVARSRELWSSLIVGTLAGSAVEGGLTCH